GRLDYLPKTAKAALGSATGERTTSRLSRALTTNDTPNPWQRQQRPPLTRPPRHRLDVTHSHLSFPLSRQRCGERLRDDAVPGVVRVNVRAQGRRRADPSPLALAHDVERRAVEGREVRDREGALDVGDPVTSGRIHPFQY